MKMNHLAPLVLATLVSAFAVTGVRTADAEPAQAQAAEPRASQIVARIVEADLWGMGGGEVNARAVVTEKGGKQRSLAFDAKSRKHAPPLGKSLITFHAPADVAGMKFLQIQSGEGDDERFLYAPELKRSRRIAGGSRGESFMGTDFSYADLDARDLRQSASTRKPDESVGKFDCYRVEVTPKNSDAIYGRLDIWVRKDNFVPLKWVMFDKQLTPIKTLIAKELQRIDGRWLITGSRMIDSRTGRSTDLLLEKIDRTSSIPFEAFSVRAMEKG